MTAYAAVYLGGGTATTLANGIGILANTYQIKINRVEMFGPGSTAADMNLYRYAGASISGPATITPVPMRQGGPATTVTAKAGNYSSVSGSATPVTLSGTGSALHTERIASGAATSGNYAFPYDLIISPGSGFLVSLANNQYVTTLAVYYEELRLAYSF